MFRRLFLAFLGFSLLALLLLVLLVVRWAIPLASSPEEASALRRGVVASFGITVAAGAVLAWFLARWVSRPMREIRELADGIRFGRLPRHAPLLVKDEVDSVTAALGRMADELSRQMERLREEGAKLEAVVSAMQEGVVAVGPNGDVVRLNGAARSLLGLSGDPSGLRLWELVRNPELEGMLRKTLGEDAAGRVSIEVGARSVAVTASPIGRGLGAVVVARDVTEERKYDQLRKDFVANVSHELRTPLTMIRGYVETLQDGGLRDEAQAQEFLGVLDRNVGRLSALVEDLLDLSRLESGGELLKRQPVDGAALLGRLAEAYRPLAAKKRQSLQVSAEVAAPFDADPGLLEQAVSNLVDNAIKYTPEGGRIRLAASREGEEVLLAVEDDGIGIPEPDQARVFERFYRVDKSRTRALGGTGLGLSIVKHIAQLHGGSVTLRSLPGHGSTFTLRLPA